MEFYNKEKIIDRISDVFISDFDLMCESKDKINNYLTLLGVTNIYNYNDFCIDMINTSSTRLDNISYEEFQKLSVEFFIADILEEMVRLKINNSGLSDVEIHEKLMRLELDAFMIKNNKQKI